MVQILPLLALAALAGAVPTQDILRESSSQVPLTSKDTVSSEAIQKLITAAGLKKRAEDLYEIAKKSLDEYNHPTRVIGSEGWS